MVGGGKGGSVKCIFQDLAHLQRFCFSGPEMDHRICSSLSLLKLQGVGGPNEKHRGGENMTVQWIISAKRRNKT